MSDLDEFYDRLLKEGHLPSPRTYEVVVGGFGGVPLETMHMAHAVLLPVGDGTYKVMKTRYGTERDVIVPARIMHALFGTPLPPLPPPFVPVIQDNSSSINNAYYWRYQITNEMRRYNLDKGIRMTNVEWSEWLPTREFCHISAVEQQAIAVAYFARESL